MYTGEHRIFIINGAGEIVTIRLSYLRTIRIVNGNEISCIYDRNVDDERISFKTNECAKNALYLIAKKLEAIDVEV